MAGNRTGTAAHHRIAGRRATSQQAGNGSRPIETLGLISHELRTPLVAILGFGEWLEDHPQADHDLPSVARTIRAAGETLRETVDELIAFGKLSTEQLAVVMRDVPLPAFWTRAAARCGVLASPAVALNWQTRVPDVRLHTDPEQLTYVLWHVVANAMKFTERGTVDVTARVHQRSVQLRVHDSGIGIPSDQRERIFEPFWQADSSLARHHGGMGLGLYLARQILAQLGGRIAVDVCNRRGSRFTLTIPLAEDRPHAVEHPSEPTAGAGA